jgi:hypothetical protein
MNDVQIAFSLFMLYQGWVTLFILLRWMGKLPVWVIYFLAIATMPLVMKRFGRYDWLAYGIGLLISLPGMAVFLWVSYQVMMWGLAEDGFRRTIAWALAFYGDPMIKAGFYALLAGPVMWVIVLPYWRWLDRHVNLPKGMQP